MGEFQDYEFLAIDRPLTPAEQEAVSRLSRRVEPHPWRATFVYHWSGLPADPKSLLAHYYDTMLYVANWGTRRLMFRLPHALFDPERVLPYVVSSREFGESLSVSHVGEYIILDIEFQNVNQGEWLEGEGRLDQLVGLREDLRRQDDRFLYLVWLKGLTDGEVGEDELEPPVPPGLHTLTPALRSFVELFAVDPDLLDIAAERSGTPPAVSEQDLRRGLAALSLQEKDEFLLRLARGEPLLSVALNRRLAASLGAPAPARKSLRAARDLLAAQEARQEQRRQEQAARVEAERLAALEALAAREAEAWAEIETLLRSYQAKSYDEATLLLVQLGELAVHRGQEAAFRERLGRLAEAYSRRATSLDRLRAAGLLPGKPSRRYASHVGQQFVALDEEPEDEDKDADENEDEDEGR